VPVIITQREADPVLENEAKRQGAIVILNPIENPTFLERVDALLAQHRRASRPIRRWPRKHIARPVEAQLDEAPARVVDVSYGGLRLGVARARQLPREFQVSFPRAGFSVTARTIWTDRAADDYVWCGAEVVGNDASMSEWRGFVDSA